MRREAVWCVATLLLALAVGLDARASQVSSYLKLEGVPGEKSPPGQPDAIAADSVSLGSAFLAISKAVDSTSSTLAADEIAGTPFADLTVSLYDDPNTAAAPDATLVLHTGLITSIQPATGGEQVSFQFASPSVSMFLALPGVTGESSAPGAAGVIALQSVTFGPSGMTVVKALDSTSSALHDALLTAHPYTAATLLFYTDLPTETHPDFSLVYQHALVSQFTDSGAEDQFRETVTFDATGSSVGHPLPEPWGGAALALGLLALARKRGR
jgi:hypothetical protein